MLNSNRYNSNMDKKQLYDQAKEAYYNGEPIMTDLEFDELENELGLENQGYVGTHHQKSYTVKHPFIMGSLSKVQIKEGEDHTVDWDKFTEQIWSYLNKSKKGHENDKWGWYYESTCKYDGCSFEVVISPTGELISVSTRGDGEWGKDIKVWFEDEWKKSFEPKIHSFLRWFNNSLKYFIVRGECLVSIPVFNEKYANDFTLPRSFVSGVLGQDWEGTEQQKEMRKDLSWICYDYRIVYNNGTIEELDYSDPDPKNQPFGNPFFPGEKAEVLKCEILDLKMTYETFDSIRKNHPMFAMDGFVFKPGVQFRLQDGDRTRQEDCVAVKFLPEIVDATLIDVEWNVGKTGEYYPTGIIDEIIIGGKKNNRVSLANYGTIVKNNIGIGSKLKISLAGDIIPFCYKVVTGGEKVKLPEDSYVDGVHLMKVLSQEQKTYIKFINSINVLKPDGIGEKVAAKLFEIFPTDNIVDFMLFENKWKPQMDDSKSSQNIIKAIEGRKKTLNLQDLIQSMGFENCGEKNALWLAKKFSGLEVDTKGIPTTIIELSEDSKYQFNVSYMVKSLGINLLEEESSDKTPVILTGSPKECGYNTKADFLAKHPQFVETTKWAECKILFTDDLESTSSKMEKAKKLGIEIKRYI